MTPAETIREQKICWICTPEYHRSFKGRFIWIFTGKGSLRLTAESLSLAGAKTSFEIPLDSITQVACGAYSRWSTVLLLNHMAITHRRGGVEETIWFTPLGYLLMPKWEVNKLVVSWIESVNAARAKK